MAAISGTDHFGNPIPAINLVRWSSALCQKLNIDYNPDNEILNIKLDKIAMSSIVELGHILGIPKAKWDCFTDCGAEQTLLLNYCMYEYYNMSADFQENYANELAQCKQKWAVLCYAEEHKAITEGKSEQN